MSYNEPKVVESTGDIAVEAHRLTHLLLPGRRTEISWNVRDLQALRYINRRNVL